MEIRPEARRDDYRTRRVVGMPELEQVKTGRFELGRVVATPGVLERLKVAGVEPRPYREARNMRGA